MFQLHQYHKEYKKDVKTYEISGTDIVCHKSMYVFMCLKMYTVVLFYPYFPYWVKAIRCGVHNTAVCITRVQIFDQLPTQKAFIGNWDIDVCMGITWNTLLWVAIVIVFIIYKRNFH